MKKIFLFIILITALFNSKSFAQILTKEDLKKIVNENKFDINLFTRKNFKMKYDGPKKEGGSIIHLQNKKANELLFLYEDDNKNFESLLYYLPNKNECYNLYLELKSIDINVSKLRKMEENGKIYYQIEIRNKEKNNYQ